MKIHSLYKDYEVIIENNTEFIFNLIKEENAGFVIDEKVYGLYSELFDKINPERIVLVEAIEENKTMDTVLSICEMMTKIPAKRNAHLISVGGGIIQDITGFVANILYRGIKWTFVPTTLLASCDSCVGGKTSLNYKKFKNLLGTFYPPDKIHICPKFFETLSERDYKSGLGEVIKFNIMAGEKGLENIENGIDSLLMRDYESLNRFVKSSLEYKKDYIEKDEFDRGERIKLNFAHTFGHAIETVTDYAIPHGTAVAIGMIMANKTACSRELLDEEFSEKSEKILLKVIDIDINLLNVSLSELIGAMRKDKKQIGEQLTAVLMSGKADDLIIVHNLEEAEVKAAIDYFKRIYISYKNE